MTNLATRAGILDRVGEIPGDSPTGKMGSWGMKRVFMAGAVLKRLTVDGKGPLKSTWGVKKMKGKSV